MPMRSPLLGAARQQADLHVAHDDVVRRALDADAEVRLRAVQTPRMVMLFLPLIESSCAGLLHWPQMLLRMACSSKVPL